MKYCSKCGLQCSDEIKFCKSCGNPFVIVGIKEELKPKEEIFVTEIPDNEILVSEEPGNIDIFEPQNEKETTDTQSPEISIPVEDSIEIPIVFENGLNIEIQDEINEDKKNVEIENDAFKSQIQKGGVQQTKEKPPITIKNKVNSIKSKSFKVIGLISILICICGLFIFRNNIKQIFDSSHESSVNGKIDIDPENINTSNIKDATTSPQNEKNINSNLENSEITVPSKNLPDRNQVKSNEKPASKNKLVITPELKTVSDYFTFLSNSEIPYNDKTAAKNEFIRNHFSSKNFKVSIKGENGYITGKITIDDLTEELRLNNTPITIVTIKRPIGLIVTELTISYK